MSYHKRQHNKPAGAEGNAGNGRPNVSLSHLCSENDPSENDPLPPSLAGGDVSSVSARTSEVSAPPAGQAPSPNPGVVRVGDPVDLALAGLELLRGSCEVAVATGDERARAQRA